MKFKRGDIALARFPHASGGRGKKRPVAVVQDDSYNRTLRHVIVAEITEVSVPGEPAGPARGPS
jgi:mRNA-degrading endonuclease toxin of MazEF toxin-antitoxin module